MCPHKIQLHQQSRIPHCQILCTSDGTHTEASKSKRCRALAPAEHGTIIGFSGVTSHPPGKRDHGGYSTHCPPNRSCEPDTLQSSLNTTDALVSFTGESLSLPYYIRKVRHRDMKCAAEGHRAWTGTLLQAPTELYSLNPGKTVRCEAIRTPCGGSPASDKGCHSLFLSQVPDKGLSKVAEPAAGKSLQLPTPGPIPMPCWPQET